MGLGVSAFSCSAPLNMRTWPFPQRFVELVVPLIYTASVLRSAGLQPSIFTAAKPIAPGANSSARNHAGQHFATCEHHVATEQPSRFGPTPGAGARLPEFQEGRGGAPHHPGEPQGRIAVSAWLPSSSAVGCGKRRRRHRAPRARWTVGLLVQPSCVPVCSVLMLVAVAGLWPEAESSSWPSARRLLDHMPLRHPRSRQHHLPWACGSQSPEPAFADTTLGSPAVGKTKRSSISHSVPHPTRVCCRRPTSWRACAT